ncbi:hypothetical protein PMAYCL1PPCAC_33401, partial [Pristionchus mayeri]
KTAAASREEELLFHLNKKDAEIQDRIKEIDSWTCWFNQIQKSATERSIVRAEQQAAVEREESLPEDSKVSCRKRSKENARSDIGVTGLYSEDAESGEDTDNDDDEWTYPKKPLTHP